MHFDEVDKLGIWTNPTFNRPTALSSGHQRFLEIARVLMGRPAVILLHEPAAGLSTSDIDAPTTDCALCVTRG